MDLITNTNTGSNPNGIWQWGVFPVLPFEGSAMAG